MQFSSPATSLALMPQTVAVTKKIGLHYTLTGIVKTDCVVPLGLEPSQTEPKPVVLPLHHGTIYVYVSRAEKGFVMMMRAKRHIGMGPVFQFSVRFFAR